MERSITIHTLSLILIMLFTIVNSNPTHASQFRVRLNQVVGDKSFSDDIVAEIRFGRKVAARILGRERLYNDPDLTRYINLVGNSLAQHASRTELVYHFAILDRAYPNAYSTPGGYVFITRGAINAAQDEAELAGVLAHEIAHVTLRHIVKDLNIHGTEKSNLSGLAHILSAFSDTTRVALSQTVDKAISILFAKGFNGREELEADQTATMLLAETGYDPAALRRYLQRLADDSRSSHDQEVQTHPPTTERLQALDKLFAEEALDALSFPTVKNRFNKMTGRAQ